MNIGEAIRTIRTNQKLSQDELAQKLFVSRDLVAKWETGARRPEWSMIERIARELDVSVETIVNKNDIVFSELSKCLPKNCKLSVDEISDVLNSFLETRGETESNLFLARYYYLKSNSEISRLFDIKESTVRTILTRLRRKFNDYVKEKLK